MVYYIQDPFLGNLYVFILWITICILFHGHNYLDTICILFHGHNYFGFGYYMFLFHAETNAFSHRVTSYNRKSYRETSLDMSGENRKFMMKWDFPDESSDCHVISDELVFEVKFVSKVCQ